ncbi:hypothetical protein ACG33_09315 [Steroidobacter denitrificans]|uniref:Lipoprotein SmpA/OmlA domain-containing protein n=1 Tax=Steroidobacter denitrificans TaxID=465721 RepID=A0A127FCJ6_STEDE|nr:hypothetical protein [Steroidobacter denitrificans]AMN47288.1 hypothetical protein ACG33_09315 [Steroidobacter denitrificans]
MKFPTLRTPRQLLLILASLTLGAPVLTQADELTMPQAESASQLEPASRISIDHPRRGMSMQKVESLFGAPVKRLPAVGQPPISRWEYQGFVVYFEHDRVLHSVIKG